MSNVTKCEKFGKVYLVGAGPGNKDLLTLRAYELILKCDIVFYDHLVSDEILALIPEQSQKKYVGKRGDGESSIQKDIEDALVEAASLYKNILRLKGGDPFIFGRGGEEAQRLAKEKISYEIVPGISSFLAAAAYSGVPLTHRDYGSTLAIVTGHQAYSSDIDFNALAKMDCIVILMSVKNIGFNAAQLIAAGKDPKTPVMIVRWASTPKQKTSLSTLEELEEKIKSEHWMPPIIFIIGKTAALHPELKWFHI